MDEDPRSRQSRNGAKKANTGSSRASNPGALSRTRSASPPRRGTRALSPTRRAITPKRGSKAASPKRGAIAANPRRGARAASPARASSPVYMPRQSRTKSK